MSRVSASILRRVSRRPLRWFLGLWLVLGAVWLAAGALNGRRETTPAVAPPPTGVRYDEMAVRGTGWPVPAERPSFVPAHEPRDATYTVWSAGGGDDRRLICQFETMRFAFGWPRRWLRLTGSVAFDVTDPTRPFPRATRPVARPRAWRFEPAQLGWTRVGRGGSTWWRGQWVWTDTVTWVFGLEAVAALLVGAAWMLDAVTHRRRLRLGRCAACGYDRRGIAAARPCPECGRAPAAAEPASGRSARVFLAVWLVLMTAWFTVSMRARDAQAVDIDRLLRRMVMEANRDQRTAISDWVVSHDRRGWPLTVRTVIGTRRYACDPGGTPAARTATAPPTGIRTQQGRLYWSRTTTDPTLREQVNIYWAAALAQAALLQLPAIPLAGLVVGGLAILRRRRRHARPVDQRLTTEGHRGPRRAVAESDDVRTSRR